MTNSWKKAFQLVLVKQTHAHCLVLRCQESPIAKPDIKCAIQKNISLSNSNSRQITDCDFLSWHIPVGRLIIKQVPKDLKPLRRLMGKSCAPRCVPTTGTCCLLLHRTCARLDFLFPIAVLSMETKTRARRCCLSEERCCLPATSCLCKMGIPPWPCLQVSSTL